ncbi:MAG: isoaspartyl peptidase/L-asparaginase, partial [Acidimicrobiales bacterium]
AMPGPGTVGAVALDGDGHVAAATSTGGRAGQRPGRVGDTPIIGAGTWADDRTAAISATGTGELFILAGFAHRVDWAMRSGSPLGPAMVASLGEVSALGGTGGAVAISAAGLFAAAFDTPAMARGWRDGGGEVVRV